MNKLEQILFLQKKNNICHYDSLTLKEKQAWSKDLILCAFDEMNLIMHFFNWAHWVPRKAVRIPDLKFQLAALLSCVISLMLVWGMDAEEIFQLYTIRKRKHVKHNKK